jgi:hypothetical protein
LSEIVAQEFEDELEAETAAGMLRANGVSARVRFRATMGPPHGVAPIRVIAPSGAYELVIDDRDAQTAADLLEDSGGPSARPQRYRWLGIVLIALFVGPLVVNFVASAIARLR